MAHDVFISHAAKDKPIADAMCAALEASGTRCWIAPRDVLPGVPWGEAIIDGINESRILILIFSSISNNSQQVMREVERAASKGIPIIPFRIEDVPLSKNLEFFLAATQWLDALTPPLEKHLQKLAETSRHLLSPRPGPAATRVPTERDVARGRKPRLWLILAALAGAFILAAVFGYHFYVESELKKEVNLPNLVIKSRPTVAVIGFKNLSARLDKAWISTALSEELTTELSGGQSLRIIPRESIARMKIELSLADAESYAKDTLARIGAILGTDKVVVGSYLALGKGQIRLDVQTQDTKSGEILASFSEDGTEQNLLTLIASAGARLRQKLGAGEPNPAEENRVRASLPSNTEASRLYSEGLAKLRVFDALAARDLLKQAVALEPEFPLAHSALAATWKTLGYDEKYKEEAKAAFDRSSSLTREDRLLVEGEYDASENRWPDAVGAYKQLFYLFPDDVEHGLLLAQAQSDAGAPKDAQDTIRRLRELPDWASHDPRIDLVEASVFRSLSDYKGQLDLSTTAAAKGEKQGARLLVARARASQGYAYWKLGQFDKARAAFDDAKQAFAAVGDRDAVADTLNHIANLISDQGDMSGAMTMYGLELAEYRDVGDKRGMAQVFNNTAWLLSQQGDLTGAKTQYEKALPIYQEIGDNDDLASVEDNLASVIMQQGNYGDARKLYEQALSVREQIGSVSGEATSLYNIGNWMLLQGDLAGAKDKTQESLSHSQAIEDKSGIAYCLFNLGEVLRLQGDLAGARKNHEQAALLRKEIGENGNYAESQQALGELALEQGRFDDANALAAKALEEFQKEGETDRAAKAAALLARCFLGQQKIAEAQKAVARAQALAAKSLDREVPLKVSIASARVRAASRQPAEAGKVLRASLAQATKLGLLPEQLDIRLAVGEIEIKFGRSSEGRVHLAGLEKEASAKGFGLIAQQAAAAASR